MSLAHEIVDRLVEGDLDPGSFYASFEASLVSVKALQAVFMYINAHPDGDYRTAVSLWNKAGNELRDIKQKLGTFPDENIRALFRYMNAHVGQGSYTTVARLSSAASKEIAAAVETLENRSQQEGYPRRRRHNPMGLRRGPHGKLLDKYGREMEIDFDEKERRTRIPGEPLKYPQVVNPEHASAHPVR